MPSYITRSCRQFISIATLCGMGRSPSANKRFLTSSEGYGYSNSGTQIAETSMWLPFLLYSIAILSDILSDKQKKRIPKTSLGHLLRTRWNGMFDALSNCVYFLEANKYRDVALAFICYKHSGLLLVTTLYSYIITKNHSWLGQK